MIDHRIDEDIQIIEVLTLARVETGGSVRYYNTEGNLHRISGPAVTVRYDDDDFITRYWYKNGLRHRDRGPATIYASGSLDWRINGQLHREDGPAKKSSTGEKRWYLNGVWIDRRKHKKLVRKKSVGN